MPQIKASDVVKHRLGLASRRLGTASPVPVLSRLIDDSFSLPVGDPTYGRNLFTPGYMPLEHSFSERSGSCLRLDMEPCGSRTSPSTRSNETSRVMRSLVRDHYGDGALRWFDQRSEHIRRGQLGGDHRFGAWFGAAVDESGLRESKIY